jgi:hypothetical protein
MAGRFARLAHFNSGPSPQFHAHLFPGEVFPSPIGQRDYSGFDGITASLLWVQTFLRPDDNFVDLILGVT